MLAFWLRHELPLQQINERDRNVDFSIGVVIKPELMEWEK